TTGGGADVSETTAADDAASAAAARLVMISILPAIDGRDHQKFDVRIRDERTPLNLEIDLDDVIRKRDAELRDWDVAIVPLIRVERGTIGKGNHQRGVIGSRRSDDILANLQVDHAV